MGDITQQPITNIAEAERYFKAMGCSHFHLSREDLDRREEYRALKISKKLESKWWREEIERGFQGFQYHASLNPEGGWVGFFSLKELLLGHAKKIFAKKIQHEDFSRMLVLAKGFLLIPHHEQIPMVLSAIIGSSDTKARGGIIEKCHRLGMRDLMKAFAEVSRALIEKARSENIDLRFVRGYYCDVVRALRIEESHEYLEQLKKEDEAASFRYYTDSAHEGNIFAMRMLAQCYRDGKGCEKSKQDARFWLQKAAETGSKLAQKELRDLASKF